MGPAIVILGISALPLAQKLKAELGGTIHSPRCVAGGDVHFQKATEHLSTLFAAKEVIIGLCASGIIIRAIAKQLGDKRSESPVLAVAADGSSVVPLLGGHHGANQWAKRIAEVTGGHAAVTTASDVRFGGNLDEPIDGYHLTNPQDMKSATSALLAGAVMALKSDATSEWPVHLEGIEVAIWTPDFRGVTIEVSYKEVAGGPLHLVYAPMVLAVGLGCERGTSGDEIRILINDIFAQHKLSQNAIASFASIDLKEDEPAIRELSSVVYFSAEQLNEQSAKLSEPSDYVKSQVGTPSVAEAAALAAAGANSKLIVNKSKSQRATIAVALSPDLIAVQAGRIGGHVSVLGVGPGHSMLRTQELAGELAKASDWVGYGLYLDLVEDLRRGQTLHCFPLGGEEDRCRHAIDLAKQGKRVALVCSGDAGIYAMAALVYELIDREPCRVAVEVHPGISAFQMASAKVGAMIGHDFCCISLSDLLTPWETIVRRVTAAAEGDFVISFYNPRSLKRTDQINKAFEILKPHRRPDTPVVLASSLGRPEENIRVLRFDEFKAEEVDMLTLVMVGSTQSKAFKRGDGQTYAYTPRGYAKKMNHT